MNRSTRLNVESCGCIWKHFIVFIAISIILYPGCGEEQSIEESYPLNIKLAPRTQEGTSPQIDLIRIIVEGDDMKTIIEEFTIDTEKSELSDTIDIPVGSDRKISVEAWLENELKYRGTETITGQEQIDIFANENPLIEIMLDPVTEKLVKLFPLRIEKESGEIFSVNIVVKNFDELVGMTFKLDFDENYVKPVELDALGLDKLFGNNVLFIDNLDLESREPGTWNIGITRTDKENPLDSEGIIAGVKFEALAAGETTIEIDYDNLVWTEKDDFPPPNGPKEDGLSYSDRGRTKVIIGGEIEPPEEEEQVEETEQ